MNQTPQLTIRDIRVRTVQVPMAIPLQTSSGTISIAQLALIDLYTEEGITGSSYLFCYTPLALKPVAQLLGNLLPLIKGDAVSPLALDRKLQGRFRLLGAKGIVGMALAGIDMAAWDALSKAQGMPLARSLGGEPCAIPAYNSCGLGIVGAERAAAEAQQLAAPGFGAIKVRLGYPEVKEDINVVRAVRKSVGNSIKLMSDYNQALTAAEAVRRIQALENEGLFWIEEPTLADDYTGYAHIRSKAKTAIQMGENWWGPHEMAKCLAAGATDYAMPDAMKIGGVTGWLRAAAIAETAGVPVSSHLFPEISVHLLTITATRHWLEYVDWANPILEHPLDIKNGLAIAPDMPGSGISWNEAGVERYLVT